MTSPSSKAAPPGARESRTRPRVGLFVTCLVDLLRPSVGFAAVALLEEAGCEVAVPLDQTCCGQPAWNSGDRGEAAALAKRVIRAFEPFDHVVAPSGSCAGMIARHYPAVLEGEGEWAERARRLAAKTHELVSFLVDVRGVERVSARWSGRVVYHDACAGLRELGVREQPRRLLAAMDGVTVLEPDEREACCGFGGTFAVKYDEISNAMVTRKCVALRETGADLVLAGDLGCLMNIAGKLRREGSAMACRHVAEILAGMTDTPPIGAGKAEKTGRR